MPQFFFNDESSADILVQISEDNSAFRRYKKLKGTTRNPLHLLLLKRAKRHAEASRLGGVFWLATFTKILRHELKSPLSNTSITPILMKSPI